MDTLHRIEHWADTHHPRWVDFVRMGLGVYIFAKGVDFMIHLDGLRRVMAYADGNMGFLSMSFLAHYIIFAHLVGGLLIAMGVATRIAILFQLPILIGAVFFINRPQGIYNSELWEALIVLILLVVFLVYGSGKVSVSQYMRTHRIK